MTNFEIISCISMAITGALAIISLIFSIISTCKVNNIKKKNKYYDGLFKDFLLYKMPAVYEKYIHNSIMPNLSIEQQFEEIIGDFRNSIIAMKFVNEKFYSDVDSMLINIEDTVVRISNHTDEYGSLKGKLFKQICELYAEINKFFN